jgi:hypothetical protein
VSAVLAANGITTLDDNFLVAFATSILGRLGIVETATGHVEGATAGGVGAALWGLIRSRHVDECFVSGVGSSSRYRRRRDFKSGRRRGSAGRKEWWEVFEGGEPEKADSAG